MKKAIIYSSLKSLTPVIKVLDEAAKAIKDEARTIKTSDIPDVLGAACGASIGGAVGFAALYAAGTTGLSAAGITSGLAAVGGIVGGGMVAGIAVLAAPAVVLGVGGYAVLARHKKKVLVEKKEMLLQEAIKKRDAVLRQLAKETHANSERLEYLNSMVVVLKGVVKDLEQDLKRDSG